MADNRLDVGNGFGNGSGSGNRSGDFDRLDLDRLLDAGIAGYSATEPRAGLERRVMARVAAAEMPGPRRWYAPAWVWQRNLVSASGLRIAGLCMLLIVFAFAGWRSFEGYGHPNYRGTSAPGTSNGDTSDGGSNKGGGNGSSGNVAHTVEPPMGETAFSRARMGRVPRDRPVSEGGRHQQERSRLGMAGMPGSLQDRRSRALPADVRQAETRQAETRRANIRGAKARKPDTRPEVFPTPAPLTAEERALLAFVTEAPKDVQQSLIDAAIETTQPISIAALHIEPLQPLAPPPQSSKPAR